MNLAAADETRLSSAAESKAVLDLLAKDQRIARGSAFVINVDIIRDWAGDRTSFPREIAEHALAHAIGEKSENAYRRGDALEKRRRLMEAWAEYCSKPTSSGKVVTLRGAL